MATGPFLSFFFFFTALERCAVYLTTSCISISAAATGEEAYTMSPSNLEGKHQGMKLLPNWFHNTDGK